MQRSEHKAFLSVHLCLPLHAWKYEQLEKIMGICQQVYLHGAARLKQYMFVIFPGVKIHHYLFLARDEVLQTSASQSWSFATLCKGIFHLLYTQQNIGSPEQKRLKNIRGKLRHLAVWTKKKSQ